MPSHTLVLALLATRHDRSAGRPVSGRKAGQAPVLLFTALTEDSAYRDLYNVGRIRGAIEATGETQFAPIRKELTGTRRTT